MYVCLGNNSVGVFGNDDNDDAMMSPAIHKYAHRADWGRQPDSSTQTDRHSVARLLDDDGGAAQRSLCPYFTRSSNPQRVNQPQLTQNVFGRVRI